MITFLRTLLLLYGRCWKGIVIFMAVQFAIYFSMNLAKTLITPNDSICMDSSSAVLSPTESYTTSSDDMDSAGLPKPPFVALDTPSNTSLNQPATNPMNNQKDSSTTGFLFHQELGIGLETSLLLLYLHRYGRSAARVRRRNIRTLYLDITENLKTLQVKRSVYWYLHFAVACYKVSMRLHSLSESQLDNILERCENVSCSRESKLPFSEQETS